MRGHLPLSCCQPSKVPAEGTAAGGASTGDGVRSAGEVVPLRAAPGAIRRPATAHGAGARDVLEDQGDPGAVVVGTQELGGGDPVGQAPRCAGPRCGVCRVSAGCFGAHGLDKGPASVRRADRGRPRPGRIRRAGWSRWPPGRPGSPRRRHAHAPGEAPRGCGDRPRAGRRWETLACQHRPRSRAGAPLGIHPAALPGPWLTRQASRCATDERMCRGPFTGAPAACPAPVRSGRGRAASAAGTASAWSTRAARWLSGHRIAVRRPGCRRCGARRAG